MTNKNVFLDVNVIIDFIDNQRPRHDVAVELFRNLILGDYVVYISEDMMTTIFYVLGDKKRTLQFFKVILKTWKIVPFGERSINKAIDLALKNNFDLEDILQCICAKENNCNILITSDHKFYDCGISIYSIKEFLKIM